MLAAFNDDDVYERALHMQTLLGSRTYNDHVKAFCRSVGVKELSNHASRRQSAPTCEKKKNRKR